MTAATPVPADVINDLLVQTSRTFALAIPLLPEPSRLTVSLAYLLFRIADTLEDAAPWSIDERRDALAAFADGLDANDGKRVASLAVEWVDAKPSTHAGYLRLLGLSASVMATLDTMPPGAGAAVRKHVARTARGMRDMVARADVTKGQAAPKLESLQDLKDYCYIVAGIVGEMLTEVFLLDAPQLAAERATLEEHQAAFGECLQLVNILKDEREDASEGRRFLPAGVERADVLALARADLARATAYVEALVRAGAPNGFVAFTSLPKDLAALTLDLLETDGAGAKVPRDKVVAMFQEYAALAVG